MNKKMQANNMDCGKMMADMKDVQNVKSSTMASEMDSAEDCGDGCCCGKKDKKNK